MRVGRGDLRRRARELARRSPADDAAAAAPAPVTAVLGDLAIGGVPRLYLDLLGHLVGSGVPCRIVAPDGPLRASAQERGIAWDEVDWDAPRRSSYRRVAGLLAPGERTLTTADPRSVHTIPALAANGPSVFVFHGAAPRIADWFEPGALERLRLVVRGLHATGALGVLTIGAVYVSEYERLLELEPGSVGLLTPGVDSAAIPFGTPPAASSSVLCICRLSPEKAPHVRAGIELMSARRAARGDGVLDVVGDGPWREEAQALCAAQLPDGAWAFHGATDRPIERMREAGVVLATGLTALEAASAGCRVAIVRTATDEEGALGPVLTPDSYATLAQDSFGARRQPPRSGADTWAALERLDADTLRAVRDRVDAEHSMTATAGSLLAAFDALGGAPHGPASVVGEAAAAAEDELAGMRRLADEIWVTRMALQREVDELTSRLTQHEPAERDPSDRGDRG